MALDCGAGRRSGVSCSVMDTSDSDHLRHYHRAGNRWSPPKIVGRRCPQGRTRRHRRDIDAGYGELAVGLLLHHRAVSAYVSDIDCFVSCGRKPVFAGDHQAARHLRRAALSDPQQGAPDPPDLRGRLCDPVPVPGTEMIACGSSVRTRYPSRCTPGRLSGFRSASTYCVRSDASRPGDQPRHRPADASPAFLTSPGEWTKPPLDGPIWRCTALLPDRVVVLSTTGGVRRSRPAASWPRHTCRPAVAAKRPQCFP